MADTTTDTNLAVDAEALRAEVSKKYSEVAVEPDGDYHFHTGRPLAARPLSLRCRWELITGAALMPFASVHFAAPIAPVVLASDASPWGCGVSAVMPATSKPFELTTAL